MMVRKNFITSLHFQIVVICLLNNPANAQEVDSLRQGVKYGFLPVISFNTDDGFLLGADVRRFQYGDGSRKPFDSFTSIYTYYKTDGAFVMGFFRDEVEAFDTDKRVSYGFYSTQNNTNYFFGDTDSRPVDLERFEETDYYTFRSFNAEIGGSTRWPVHFSHQSKQIDLKTGIHFIYQKPWDTPSDRFLYENDITGNEGAFLTLFELALVIERRNLEFRAEEGVYFEGGFKYSPPVLSTHHTLENYFQVLGFLPLIEKGRLTLATKVLFQNTVGETPYWRTPFLGGSALLRGYMFRRFTSDNVLAYTAELRTWIFRLPFYNIEMGGNLFLDGGRAFANSNWGGLFSEHKHTLGFGGVMSIFTPDYILKYDIGFSEDGIGIYLGTGYSF